MRAEGAGLYVHVPFCSAVCPYCDFAVQTGGPADRRRYLQSLLHEIELRRGSPLRFDTLYLGGGTPSALSADELGRVLEAARRALTIDAEASVSMEANPEDVSAASLAGWRALGVHTLSLGVQSFDAGALKLLGRRHSPEEARRSVSLALEAGFDTVSVDLIFALPGRDEASWREELEAVVALGPTHVSCYQLTFHEGTPFHRRRERGSLVEPGEARQAELFRLTHRLLGEAGFEAYEVSNFARSPRHRSRHNRKYWTHAAYLGLGPSAHSFEDRSRWWNLRGLEEWRASLERGCLPIGGEEELSSAQLALEALMLGLRTTEGVSLELVRERTGLDLLPANRALLERLESEGLLSRRGSRLVPSLEGLAIADSLPALFELS